jgi:hypothetical protein
MHNQSYFSLITLNKPNQIAFQYIIKDNRNLNSKELITILMLKF